MADPQADRINRLEQRVDELARRTSYTNPFDVARDVFSSLELYRRHYASSQPYQTHLREVIAGATGAVANAHLGGLLATPPPLTLRDLAGGKVQHVGGATGASQAVGHAQPRNPSPAAARAAGDAGDSQPARKTSMEKGFAS